MTANSATSKAAGNGAGRAARQNGEASAAAAADRKATILRAAIDVFATKGYHGCRIADVAREAKVAYGLVYHYFKNKDELLQSVFRAGWDFFVGRLKGAIAQGKTLDERVRGICDVCFEAYRKDPRAVRVLVLQVARSPAIGGRSRQNAFEEIIRLVTAMFVEAKAAGELRPGMDPTLCALLLFGALEMGLTAFVVGLSDTRDVQALERAKQQIAASFLGGVSVTGAAGAPLPEGEWKSEKSATRSRAARRS